MDMEETIDFNGYIDLTAKETIEIPNINELNGDYTVKYLSNIFGSGIYTDVNYLFDYSKVLALFKEYQKYGNEDQSNCLIYDAYKNGGVDFIEDIAEKNIQPDDNGCFIANITIEAHGGKSFGWGGYGWYGVELFKYREDRANLVLTCKFTNTDLLYDFLSRLIKCVVGVDKEFLTKTINANRKEIKSHRKNIKVLFDILGKNYNTIQMPKFCPAGEDCGIYSNNHDNMGFLLRINVETPLNRTSYLLSFDNEEEAKRAFIFNRDSFKKDNEGKRFEVVEDSEYVYHANLEGTGLLDKGNRGLIMLVLYKIANNSGTMYSY